MKTVRRQIKIINKWNQINNKGNEKKIEVTWGQVRKNLITKLDSILLFYYYYSALLLSHDWINICVILRSNLKKTTKIHHQIAWKRLTSEITEKNEIKIKQQQQQQRKTEISISTDWRQTKPDDTVMVADFSHEVYTFMRVRVYI